MFATQMTPIRIVARPKRLLLGEHWGVQLPDSRVVHLTTDGAAIVSFEAFTEGKRWRVVRVAHPCTTHQVLWRVSQALGRPQPYRLLDRNCETFANELLGDPPESPQVQGVLLLAFGALVLKAVS